MIGISTASFALRLLLAIVMGAIRLAWNVSGVSACQGLAPTRLSPQSPGRLSCVASCRFFHITMARSTTGGRGCRLCVHPGASGGTSPVDTRGRKLLDRRAASCAEHSEDDDIHRDC